MGLLRHTRTGRPLALAARTLVGRGPNCTLQINDRMVSTEHAALWWANGGWQIRDLGSRNGTWVGESRLAAGAPTQVPEGATIAFGHAEESWKLVDAGGPVALALAEDGRIVEAEDGLLVLPSDEEPLATIYEGPRGEWICEGMESVREVHSGSAIAIGGVAWQLLLPVAHMPTMGPTAVPVTLEQSALRFLVSGDEETVEIEIVSGGKTTRLAHRVYHYLLLVLARQRVEDAALSEGDRGWLYADDLCKMLRIDPPTLNVHIYRARKRLGKHGLVGAAGAIERRPASGQVRLGIDSVSEGPL